MNTKIVSQIIAGIFAVATTWLTVAYTKQAAVNKDKTESISTLEQRVKALEAGPTEGQGSPYVHWSSVVTDLPLQQCEALTREAYRLTGTVVTENPDMDESSVAQIGVAGSVSSVIVCVRTGEKTTVMVIASGPDQTITKNRQAQLRDVVQNELGRLLRSQ